MTSITTTVTTPITMMEYAKSLEQASLSRIFVENMAKQSDIMAAIPFAPANNGKLAFEDISSLPSVSFRNFNAGGGQATGTTNLREEDTFPIDEYIYTDRAIVDRLGTRGKYRQQELKTIALAQYFSQIVINGDNTASSVKQPNGIKARCSTVNYNLLHNSASSGGAALSLAKLDELIWLVNKPTHWIFPRGLMPKMATAARSSSLTGQQITVDNTNDEFGRRIYRYAGLPILFGYEPDDTTDLLPFTEVASGGGSAVTGSIYLASFRDGGFYAAEQTPLSVEDEGQLKGAPQHSIHIKWDWGLVQEHPRSAARLTSITNAAIAA